MAVPVDLVPAAHRVIILPARAVAGLGDHIITGNITGRVVALIDPTAPAAGIDVEEKTVSLPIKLY